MEKRPLAGMFLACVLGILGVRGGYAWLLFGGAVVLYPGIRMKSKRGWEICLLTMMFLLAGGIRQECADSRYRFLKENFIRREADNRESTIKGMVCQVKESEKAWQLKIHHCVLLSEKGNTVLSIPDIMIYQSKTETRKPPAEGEYLLARGVVLPGEKPRNDGGYDEEGAFYGSGILGKMFYPGLQKIPVYGILKWESRFYHGMGYLKERMRDFFKRQLPEEEAGLLSTICLGKKECVSDEVRECFSNAGIAHILAISATHISAVGITVLSILKRRKFSLKVPSAVSFILVLAFALGTGGTDSAMRATLMFGVGLLGMILGESYDGFSAMAFAGSLMLFFKPYLLFSAAFRYSFVAVFALFLILEWILETYKSLHPLFQSLFVSLGVFVATFPLVVFYQGRIPTFSVILNLFILPLVAPVLVLGLAGGLLYVCGVAFVPKVFVFFSGKLAAGILMLAKASLCIPGSSLIVGHMDGFAIGGYILCILIAVYFAFKKKSFLPFLMIYGLTILVAIVPKAAGNQVIFLDVGQGDGIYMETKEGIVCMVDGGSSSETKLGEYTLKPFLTYHDKAAVDVWFISHLDEDHISGIRQLLEEGFPIKRICFFEGVKQDDRLPAFLTLVRKNKTAVSFFKKGQSFCLGSLQGKVLGEETSDVNDSSMCLYLRYPKEETAFWLGGDISRTVEEKLLEEIRKIRKNGKKKEILIMKANHHGSDFSNGDGFLEAIFPQKIIISCGKNNRYHHPGKEALERMRKAGCGYVCTMDCGQITVDLGRKRCDTKISCK